MSQSVSQIIECRAAASQLKKIFLPTIEIHLRSEVDFEINYEILGERNGLLREALRDVPHTPTIPHSLTGMMGVL